VLIAQVIEHRVGHGDATERGGEERVRRARAVQYDPSAWNAVAKVPQI